MAGAKRSVIFDHMTRPVRDDDREAFTLMDGATSYSDLPDRLKRYRDDIFDDKYKRLDWAKLSRSITAHIAKDGYWYIHPSESRTLTVREAARIQTFPDSFRFAGTRSHAFTQIGNAVPPALAASVAEGILRSLESPHITHGSTSRRWRWFRETLLRYGRATKDPWVDVGDPWAVLVHVICGRRGKGAAIAAHILRWWPEPDDFSPIRVQQMIGQLGSSNKIGRAVDRCARAGRSVSICGWHTDQWAREATLGPLATRWVQAVGLEEYAIVPTAGVRRVAARFEGTEADRTAAEIRLVIAQLVGAIESPARITAAMASLAETICRPVDPQCEICPLQHHCRWNHR